MVREGKVVGDVEVFGLDDGLGKGAETGEPAFEDQNADVSVGGVGEGRVVDGRKG